ncbi:MarR family winged helix-turn-helix transcriptional regulator [Eggerthella timonensis]|uniref:MarR family winged helix-turn-helix transcriptional regulator n=1 Tax=Eggerthella timonensis TaxID=1871008 RepID=UPI000C7944B9|nr:MarR family transcriptional regulator [Eggerthella timonensis]
MDLSTFKRELFTVTYDVQKILHETMAPVCQQYGLTLQQMHVLMELVRTPGLTAGQLSDRAGILRTNFPSVCRKLEDRGLIERQRSQTDRRSLKLRVTDEGRALLADVDGEVQRRYGEAFVAEPPETFDAIIGGFRALADFSKKLGR